MLGVHGGLPVRGGVVGAAAVPGRDARQRVAAVPVEPERVRCLPSGDVVPRWLVRADTLRPWVCSSFARNTDVPRMP